MHITPFVLPGHDPTNHPRSRTQHPGSRPRRKAFFRNVSTQG
jgi:hypothetical protein